MVFLFVKTQTVVTEMDMRADKDKLKQKKPPSDKPHRLAESWKRSVRETDKQIGRQTDRCRGAFGDERSK